MGSNEAFGTPRRPPASPVIDPEVVSGTERPPGDLPGWLGVMLTAVAPVAHFWQGTAGRIVLAPGDAVLYLFPIRRLAAQMVAQGYWPLWNPFVFSGFPFLAVSQTAVLHPGTFLFLILPALWAMNLQMIAAYVIAGIGTYAYARAVGATVFGATLAGMTFPFSGFMSAHLGHTGLVQATAWLPAVLYCAERLRHQRNVRWIAGGAAAVAVGIFAGHPQGTVLVGVTVSAYAGFFAIAERPPVGRWRYLRSCLALLTGGVLLGAVQLLPTAELVAQTFRARLTFAEFTSYALPIRQLPMLLFPFLFGGDGMTPYWGEWNLGELLGYTGLVPLIAAIVAVPLARRNLVARFWVGMAALALALTLGSATPLAAVGYHVPVWNLFRAPARAFLQFDVAVAVLAALGVSHLGPHRRQWFGRTALAMAALVACSAVVIVAFKEQLFGAQAERAGLDAVGFALAVAWYNPVVLWPVACAVVAALACLAVARWPSRLLLVAVLAVHAADLGYMGHRLLSQGFLRGEHVDVVPDYVRWLTSNGVTAGSGRVLLLTDGAPVRADLGLWDVAMANGYDPYILSRYSAVAADMTYFGAVSEAALLTRPGFLDLLNVSHLVVNVGRESWPPPRFSQRSLELILARGQALDFALPQPTAATHLDIVSSLLYSIRIADGTPVARVSVIDEAGAITSLLLNAGEDTSEWAWDSPELARGVAHRRAEVHESFPAGSFTGHRYLSRRSLPARVTVSRVRVEPLVTVQISRLSVYDQGTGISQHCTREHALLGDRARWESVFVGRRMQILRNRHALPRAWLVPSVEVHRADRILAAIRDGRLPDGAPFDPREVALVEDGPGLDGGTLDPEAAVQITRYEPNRVELRARTARPAFLVLSDAFYPGWRATVDGVDTPIVRANYVLRGLPLPPGRHAVRFTFRPRSVLLGAVVNGLAVVTLCAALTAAVWRRSRRRGPP